MTTFVSSCTQHKCPSSVLHSVCDSKVLSSAINALQNEEDKDVELWEQIQLLCQEMTNLAYRNLKKEGAPEDVHRTFNILCELAHVIKNQDAKRPRTLPTDHFIPFERIMKRKRRFHPSKTASKSTRGKVCAWCLTDETPEWRKGPHQEALCNACGLQYYQKKKADEEQKRKFSVNSIIN